ncbi:TetR/AcrR family transcriptional regulator [Tersicoccus sp. Bi-70]|uniref:TetR/AcrR family transcriptional regulator n=1 Tax=Tersicoccus sp. Bi-70 TaxID=1897634 RepID=UPI0009755BE7|nr:TetR/AcrR family transcriptional regulator [Tersicoccus sp. Bi-70]OMH36883.1 hypothetical protein BGP79_14170 [Tersicoccus sp. Bi-70]
MRSDATERQFTFIERARRAQILACATAALAERGYAGATLADIARRAGVSKGVVSYHFAGKDDLLDQLVADFYGRAGTSIAARVEAADTAADRVRGYLEANLAFVAEHADGVRAVLEIVANRRDADGALHFRPTGSDPLVDHLAGLLAELPGVGPKATHARNLAIVVRAAIDAAAGRLLTEPTFDPAAYTRDLVRLIETARLTETAGNSHDQHA